jgi:hypothetical protein
MDSWSSYYGPYDITVGGGERTLSRYGCLNSIEDLGTQTLKTLVPRPWYLDIGLLWERVKVVA